MTILEAHKGVCTECPENTHSAFKKASEQGYAMIELDPNFTSDWKIVVLHDNTLNRTARNMDGSEIAEKVEIQRITYEEACKYDYGVHFSDDFKGEKLPLLKDVFEFAKENNIELKIDNKFEKFPEEIKEIFFEMVREYDAKIGLTCSGIESIRKVIEQFPDAPIHYDGVVTEEILKSLTSLTKNITVWVPFECRKTSWVKVDFASEELCELIKKYAKLGVWIIVEDEHYKEVCERFAPDFVETDGRVKPVLN